MGKYLNRSEMPAAEKTMSADLTKKHKKARGIQRAAQAVRRFYKGHLDFALTPCILWALGLNLFIETAGRGSFIQCLHYMIGSPFTFFLNTCIIFATMTLALLFRRRTFAYCFIGGVWFALGAVNGIILTFRMTPFTVSDLALLENGLSILPNYMSMFQIVLVIVAVIALVAGYTLLFRFAKKTEKKTSLKFAVCMILIACIGTVGLTGVAMKKGWISTYFNNLGYAYLDYGVPYCFLNTWLNKGIHMPLGYSEERIVSIFDEGLPLGVDEANDAIAVTDVISSSGKSQPNVLILQLESFIDPTLIKGMTFDRDPVPNFRKLKETCSTGYLTVPAVGAGTANTEFEVLTGMRVRSFGPGEYPYKTVLKEKTCESTAYTLKKLGYGTHAIHNHRGVFYGRNEVFSNLGFDTFTSVEYMNNVTRTPKNWARDDVLTDEILSAMKSTEGPDFVFTVSVEGHGKYPTEPVLTEEDIRVHVGGLENKEDYYAALYYVYLMEEMDEFIGNLTDALEQCGEDVVLVMYGDHLPVLNLTEENMKTGNLYQTEYVIWSNFGLKKIDQDLSAFQLSAEVLSRIGLHNGTLTWYHQTHKDDGDYLENLNLLLYDMLYGEQYIYGQKNPFEPTNLRMGIEDIKIKDIFCFGEDTYVVGENFTPYSKVSFEGDLKDTIFVNSKTLKVPETLDSGDLSKFAVCQVGKYKAVLSTTNAVIQTLEDVE